MAGERTLKVTIIGDSSSAQRALDNLEGKTSRIGAVLAKAAMLTATAAAGAGAAIIKVGTEYQGALNTFQSVSQATGEQMDQVRAKAKALGADLSLPATSAGDAALAMSELVKAGLSVSDTMAAAKGVLQLSAAAAVGEAQAAEIAANALNAFKLKGDEAVRVADLLAGAANASSGEITEMADALKQSSAVFAAAGVSIEDLTTAISLMANRGIQGSDAGTSLKSMLLALQGPTNKARELMDELGLRVYDAKGRMLPLTQLIGTFTQRLGGLTQAQRDAAMATLFGSDGVRAANTVLLGGVEAFDKMREAVTRQGVAAEVAAAKTKGLRGAWNGFVSQLETIAIEIFERVSPALEGLVRWLAERVPTAMSRATQFAGAIVQSAGPLVDWLHTAADELRWLTSLFAEAATGAEMYVGKSDRLARVAINLGKLFHSFGRLVVETAEALSSAWERNGPTIVSILASIGERATVLARFVVDAVRVIVRNWGTIEPLLKGVAAVIVTVLIPHWVALGVAALVNSAKNVVAWAMTSASALAASVVHSAHVLAMVAQWALLGAQALLHAAKIAAAWLIAMGPIAIVAAAVVALVALVIANWETIKNAITTAATAVLDFLRNNWPLILAILTGPIGLAVALIVSHWETIKGAATAVKNWIVDRFNEVVAFFTGLPGRIATAASNLFEALKSAAKTAADFVVRQIDRALGPLDEALGKLARVTSRAGSAAAAAGRAVKKAIPEFDDGGVVPGPMGSAQLILAHGGETVLPTHKRAFAPERVRTVTASAGPRVNVKTDLTLTVTGTGAKEVEALVTRGVRRMLYEHDRKLATELRAGAGRLR